MQSKGEPISFDGKLLYMVDTLEISPLQSVRVEIESTNSTWKQGISISSTVPVIVNEIEVRDGFVYWEDSDFESLRVAVAGNQSGTLSIKNVWDIGNGGVESWHNGAAMILDNLENGRRYLCNDGKPDDDFDDLVFRIEFVDE